ncbi:site-specific integrase [Runella sp.]|uniref:site-specific integrase n=1 Tax=Runella sp. TaxID=1960881 RepID=UPI00263568B9|nr:site-specific integrase [Runella sp.]
MSKVHKSHLTNHVRIAERNKSKAQRNTLYVSFWERKSEVKAKIEVSIVMKLTYNGKVKNYATGVICKRGNFDKTTLKVTNNPVATLMLQDLRNKINATYAELRLTGRPINLEIIWQVSNGQILNANIPNVFGCLTLFLEQIQAQYKTGEFTFAVVEKVTTWNERIKAYVGKHYGNSAHLDDITPADAKRFLLYLKTEHEFSHNYAAGVVQHFKRVLNYAVENEWITRNPLMNYRRKLDKIKGEILTESEMDAIRSFEIFAPTLDHIRQAFLLQCYTGLSYAELVRVTTNDILRDDVTGMEYIKIDRQKTGVPSIVPLNVEAQNIIDRFKDHPQRLKKGLLMPIVSNQKYNIYLKQLAGVMGTKKRLTSHVARRTAATYYLTKGVPMESVSAMLGHTNTVTTQRSYAITRSERVIKDFMKNNIEVSKAQ